MLQKIIDFFKGLFSGFSRNKKPRPVTPPPPTTTYPTSSLPKANENEPQDGSEITTDSAVVVIKENDPIVNTNQPVDVSTVDGPDTEPEITVPETSTSTTSIPDPPITNTGSNNTSTTDLAETETPTELGEKPAQHKARFLWCLDNGHGKRTAGKRSPKLENGVQLLEYEFNRDIVKRIIKLLDGKGVKTFNVVPEYDVDNFLEERVHRTNSKTSSLPKLFISVHSNAAPAPLGKWADPNISGVETWYYHNNSRGRKIAAIFQKHLVTANNWKNRHIKSRPTNQFYVLRNTRMTAILTENGFYNNKAQCLELLKDDVRENIAKAHVAAIMEIEKNGV